MRVAIVCFQAPSRNAIGNQFAHKVRFLKEHGADVRVFVQDARDLHPELADCAQVVSSPDTEGTAWDTLREADLAIFDYPQYYPLLDWLPLLAGCRVRLAVNYHGVTPPALWTGPNREGLEAGRANLGLIAFADSVLVQSDFIRREEMAATGTPRERIHLIPPVVSLRESVGSSWRAMQGLQDATVLLFVGRLAANKRPILLVELLGRLRMERPDFHAVFLGADDDLYSTERKQCEQRAKDLGVADRTHFLGSVDEVTLASAYREANLLVMPSKHEGFCLPVMEAMSVGLPVIVARATVLPETLGPAGYTFEPDNVEDLARVVERVLPKSVSVAPQLKKAKQKHVAVVAFRYGPEIVGGAENSLRVIAKSLCGAGVRVEVFTTCTRSGHDWANDQKPGTFEQEGLTIHRLPIDPHDRQAHHRSLPAVRERPGRTTDQEEADYLRHSIHSQAILDALAERIDSLDAIITGPYLFGLTYDIAVSFPDKTLLLPCFHDEPLAYLSAWKRAYPNVGGMLFHSPEERELSCTTLGMNHPHGVVAGTYLPIVRAETKPENGRLPTIVYCGRFSEEKDVPLLIEWITRFQEEYPGRFEWEFVGQGPVEIPNISGVRNLGHLSEEAKRDALAGAAALVQLSRQESLSIVAVEAWAQGTPIVVHQDCAVLAGQIERSQGGRAIASYVEFAATFADLWENPGIWQSMGQYGLEYVRSEYADLGRYQQRLLEAIHGLSLTKVAHMRRAGPMQAERCRHDRVVNQFAAWLEKTLENEVRPVFLAMTIEPRRSELRAGTHQRSLLVAVRIENLGSHPCAAQGPGKIVLMSRVTPSGPVISSPLPAILLPGQSKSAAILVALPGVAGVHQVEFWAETRGAIIPGSKETLTLIVDAASTESGACEGLLQQVQESLGSLEGRKKLPDNYTDITLGRFARAKRWIKKKLLHNFKLGYVDVLSRQQSEVNEQLARSVAHLSECCATLDHAVRALQQRLDEVHRRQEVDSLGHHPSPPGEG